MNLESLSLHDGSEYLDEVMSLPRRGQELFFSLLNHDLFEENRDGMEIID